MDDSTSFRTSSVDESTCRMWMIVRRIVDDRRGYSHGVHRPGVDDSTKSASPEARDDPAARCETLEQAWMIVRRSLGAARVARWAKRERTERGPGVDDSTRIAPARPPPSSRPFLPADPWMIVRSAVRAAPTVASADRMTPRERPRQRRSGRRECGSDTRH